ncbi:SDH family Clp fold serine proteinase [Burkholderia stagnalis]|uniref:SDH family Clp fold serine proteinase n=1 Tax=Burkholderia stagnalis TaxID=1503054 RepID=UPI00075E86D5|nr:hypothetical protein [Burkholderia stagnalis]KWO37663.1 hypothetical protein WT96_12935 [Burkholderia stagnalis]
MKAVDQHISLALKHYASAIEQHFGADVLGYMGPIHSSAISTYLEVLEQLKADPKPAPHRQDKLVIVLTTPGGVVESAEKMVEISRHHYEEVDFVVPDYAMSAGTVWCMSGDRIWMDYASSLGPIDPQLQRQNNQLVPALGYIDKVNEFIKKSQASPSQLSPAEVLLLRGLDLAELRRFEQARDLSVTLLKQWLVAYKFKNWAQHRTTNPGSPVTQVEKEQRAEEIAKLLSDNNRWHSHGRMLSMATVRSVLRLDIEDYSGIANLRNSLRIYTTMLAEYIERQSAPIFIHTSRI